MIGPPGINLVTGTPGLLSGPSLLHRMLIALDGVIEAKRGLGIGSSSPASVIHGHVLTALATSATGTGQTGNISAGAKFAATATAGTGTGYTVTASADAFLTALAAVGDGEGYTAAVTHGNVVPATVGAGTGTGQTGTVLTTDNVPLFADQLLLAGNAYYSAGEWSDHSHLLKDHREGVGTLRDRRPGYFVQHSGTSYGTVTCPLAAANATSLTIACRVRPTGISGHEMVYSNNAGQVELRRSASTNKFELILDDSITVVSTSDVPDNTWTHILASWDADTGIGRVFINGELDTENSPVANPTLTYLSTAGIGARTDNSQHSIAGLYDLRVWTRAVTTEHEATNIYNGRETDDEAGFWPLQEEVGKRAFDVSGNGRHIYWTVLPAYTVSAELGKSWPDEHGYNPIILAISDTSAGTDWDDRHSWVAADPVQGDFEVDFYVETTGGGAIFGLRTTGTPAALSNHGSIAFGVRWIGATSLQFWESGTSSSTTTPTIIPNKISFRRTSGIIRVYVAETLVHTYSGTTGVDLYSAIHLAQTSQQRIALSYNDGESFDTGYQGDMVDLYNPLIPATDSNDALGYAAAYIGEAPSPGIYKSPTLIANGTNVKILAPNVSMTGAEGIVFTMRYKKNATGALPTLRYLMDDTLNRNTLALSGTTANQFAMNLNGTWHHFGVVPDDTDWHTVTFIKDGVNAALCTLDGSQLGTSGTYSPLAIGGTTHLLTHSDGVTNAFCNITVEYIEIKKYSDGTTYRKFVTDGVSTTMWDESANAQHGTIGGTAAFGLGDGGVEDDRMLFGGFLTTSGGTPIMVPPRLGTGLAADGNTKNVPAYKWADPNSELDRTGGVSNSVFVNLSGVTSSEAVGDDTKTATSSKVRKRTTSSYVDRAGAAQVAMSTPGCDTYFGD